jgi:hypothetical protein
LAREMSAKVLASLGLSTSGRAFGAIY